MNDVLDRSLASRRFSDGGQKQRQSGKSADQVGGSRALAGKEVRKTTLCAFHGS